MTKDFNNSLPTNKYSLLDGESFLVKTTDDLLAIAMKNKEIIQKIQIENNELNIDNTNDITYFLLDELFLQMLQNKINEVKINTMDKHISSHYLLDLNNIKHLNQYLKVNNKEYYLISLLGHGKGGYSYLVSDKNKFYVLKQIHHEPCSYYNFGNKIEAELNDYNTLVKTGINIPKMIDIDINNERILKEYIPGFTISNYVEKGKLKKEYLEQVKLMSKVLKNLNINIDYYPTNFVVNNDVLYYIDYECNPYKSEWDFDNWGSKYWLN